MCTLIVLTLSSKLWVHSCLTTQGMEHMHEKTYWDWAFTLLASISNFLRALSIFHKLGKSYYQCESMNLMNKSLQVFKYIQLFLQNTKLGPKGKHKTWYNNKGSQLPFLLLHNSNIIFDTLDLWSSLCNWSWNFDLVLLAYTIWTIA
jgi:hypothetical protein